MNADYIISRRPLHSYPKLCAECDGECCRQHSGAAYPKDFGRSRAAVLKNLRAALETGSWSVDWWEGNPKGCRGNGTPYYVRPAHTKTRYPGSVCDPSWGGTCVFFRARRGCMLPEGRRPTGCRALTPKRNKTEHHICKEKCNSKKGACAAWWSYRRDIEKMIEEVDARGTDTEGEES